MSQHWADAHIMDWKFQDDVFVPYEEKTEEFVFTDEPVVRFGNITKWGISVYVRTKLPEIESHYFMVETTIGENILYRVFVDEYPNLVKYLNMIVPIATNAM